MNRLDPVILLDVPITFQAGDTHVHTPMVVAAVGGVPTKLILDTGSSDHVFTRQLANEAGLAMEPAEPGTDSTGAPVPSWSVGALETEIEGRSFGLQDVVVIEGPPPFAGWGVGGFLSPQHLHPSAWVVLDLAADRLLLVEGAAWDVAEWLVRRSPRLRMLTLARLADDPTIHVHAAIDPFEPVATLLDIGGKSTVLAAAAVPGLAGVQGGAGHGLSGRQVVGSMVDDRTLVVGDARLPVPRLVISATMADQPGLIGEDVLRGTVLVVSADRTRPVYWQVPTR